MDRSSATILGPCPLQGRSGGIDHDVISLQSVKASDLARRDRFLGLGVHLLQRDADLRPSGMRLYAAACACLCISAWLLPVGTASAAAANTLAGAPPITRFKPDLEVFPQNFSIAQDATATLYVANANGVLIFDGARWSQVTMPNDDMVRSVAWDGAQRIYVGGYDAFGYLDRDATGREIFHDLTPLAQPALGDESFADIWDLHIAKDGVFFRALHHVFRYDPTTDTVQVWRHPGRFGAITTYQNHTLLQFRGEGLRRFDQGQWKAISGTAEFGDLIYQFLTLSDGALLALRRDGRWQRFHQGRVTDYTMPSGTPPASVFSQACALDDGSYALPADDGSLYLFDPANSHLQHLKISSGILSGVTRARDGGLLAIDNEAAIHISWPSRWTVTGADHGLNGTVHALKRWGNRWYALTGAGVQAVIEGNGARHFERRDWTDHETWDLLQLDDDNALLAESYAVKLVNKRGARAITGPGVYPRVLRRSRYDSDVVFVGGEMGLSILRREGPNWRLLVEAETGQNLLITSLLEATRGELWLGTERHGLRRLQLAEDYSAVLNQQAMNEEQGISYGRIAGASVSTLADGQLLASSEHGFFIWDGTRFKRVELGGLESMRPPNTWLQIKAATNGDLWAYSYNRVYLRTRDGAWQREPVGSILRGGIEELSIDGDGDQVLLATGDAILSYNRRATPSSRGRSARLQLRSVEHISANGEERTRLPLHPEQPLDYTQGQFGLSFRFALPDYLREGGARYQARLLGFSDHFAEWSESRVYTYNRLEPGEYRFEARAMDNRGRVSQIEPYVFRIHPVWYRSLWARALWIVLAVVTVILLTLWGSHRRAMRLERQREQLERLVADRTQELEHANTQLDVVAHIDGLTELANRRRLNDYLDQAWSWCLAAERPLALVVIDVDNFKHYNDRYGHLAGDDVLKQLGRILAHGLRRADDLAARYGGDEFVLVLPGADLAATIALTDTIRRQVEDSAIGATISAGIAARTPQQHSTVSDLVHSADEALYVAKRNGRNRIEVAQSPTDADDNDADALH